MKAVECCARVDLYVKYGMCFILLLVGANTQDLKDTQCISLNQETAINKTQEHCFCYFLEINKWYQLWSVVQLQINSTEAVGVSFLSDMLKCKNPDTFQAFFSCLLHHTWKPKESKMTHINVRRFGHNVCFVVKLSKPAIYNVNVARTEFSTRLFVLFFGGLFLFCFARDLSRNVVTFYFAGVTLGMAASLVFFLLLLKRFISKQSTFCLLLSGSCFLTMYAVQFFIENMTWLWAENKHFVTGYIVTAALLSFAACYKHGPLKSQRSVCLFTWTLRILAGFLIYFGLFLPEVAYAVIIVLLTSTGLRYVCRSMKGRKPVVRWLTEDEYREQADVETVKALEQLRIFCNSPEFNAWVTVSRLSSPKRFADFILGSNHISEEETSAHEEQYGLGSFFVEDQLFVQEPESEDYVEDENVSLTNNHESCNYADDQDINML